MNKSMLVVVALLLFPGASSQAQRPQDSESVQLYAAVLQDMPDVAKNREIAVDPRLSASFAEGAKIMDVWEQHLSRSESSPVVGLLRQRVPGIRVCPETAARSSCLRTADAVHVTFSAPVLDDSTATVEATFITRTSDDSDSFDVQTWQYSFVMTPQGPASRGRELLARGHGRVGKN